MKKHLDIEVKKMYGQSRVWHFSLPQFMKISCTIPPASPRHIFLDDSLAFSIQAIHQAKMFDVPIVNC